MTHELTKEQKCIFLRNNIEIWVDIDKIKQIEKDIMSGNIQKFIYVEGNLINIADIVGIFLPHFMEKKEKIKKGEYYCEKHKQWLPPGVRCGYC